MKRIAVLCLGITLLFSCKKEEVNQNGNINGPSESEISVSPTSMTVPPSGGSYETNIYCNGSWSISGQVEWCVPSKTKGEGNFRLSFNVSPNQSYDERNVTYTFTSGTKKAKFKLTQKQRDAITVTDSKYELTSSACSIEIEVQANVDYDYTISDGWIKAASGTKSMNRSVLIFEIDENKNVDRREGNIVFSSGKIKETVSIFQEGVVPSIVLSKDKYIVSDKGETIKVELYSNVDYDVQMPDVDWLYESKDYSRSSHTLYYTIEPNDGFDQREAYILFSNKDNNLQQILTIVQTQKDAIVLLTKSSSYTHDGGILDIEVQHNVEMETIIEESAQSWIHRSGTKALETEYVTFIIDKNNESLNREGKIIFRSADGTISQTHTVFQGSENVIVIGKKEYILSSEEQIITIDIDSNIDFNVSVSDNSWIHETNTRALNHKSLNFKIDENTTYNRRSAEIEISSSDGSISEKVRIVQVQNDAIILSKSEYSVGNDGGLIEIELQHNVEYDIECSDWIHRQPDTRSLSSSKVYFKVDTNASYEGRTGYIIFSNGTIKQQVTVIQGQCDVLLLSPTSQNISSDGGVISVVVKSNLAFSYDIPEDVRSWVYVRPDTRALSENTIDFMVEENTGYSARKAEIVFSSESGNIKETLTITQSQKDRFELSAESATLGSVGGSVSVTLYSNVGYEILIPEQDLSWIESSASSGYGDAVEIIFGVKPNEMTASRSSVIRVASPDGKHQKDFTVVQSQKDELLVDVEEIQVGSSGGTINLDVRHNVEYTVSSSSWISLQPQSRSLTTTTLSFLVGANPDYTMREGYIILSSGTLRKEIRVVQSQKDRFELSAESATLGSVGGSVSVTLYSNVGYEILIPEQDLSWIESSASSGYGDAVEIIFAVKPNEMTASRSSVIRIASPDGKHQKDFTVVQSQMDELIVDKTEFDVGNGGGEISATIRTNVEYNVSIDWSASSWISLISDDGNIIRFAVAENPTFDRRSGTITISDYSGSLTETITVRQEAAKLTLHISDNAVTVAQKSTTQSLSINTNASYWMTSSDADWCYVSPYYGYDSKGTISISCSQNDSTEPRQATINVEAFAYINNGTISEKQTIVITQEPKVNLILPGENLETEYNANTQNIKILSNTGWLATSDSDWCLIENPSGEGDAELNISISENQTDAPRIATITIIAEFDDENRVEKSFTIKQYDRNGFTIGGWDNNTGDYGGEAD